ncbi:hypothetical protein [Bacillus mycoides]|nr:hypothetical protein [Bacillus mycoides]
MEEEMQTLKELATSLFICLRDKYFIWKFKREIQKLKDVFNEGVRKNEIN